MIPGDNFRSLQWILLKFESVARQQHLLAIFHEGSVETYVMYGSEFFRKSR